MLYFVFVFVNSISQWYTVVPDYVSKWLAPDLNHMLQEQEDVKFVKNMINFYRRRHEGEFKGLEEIDTKSTSYGSEDECRKSLVNNNDDLDCAVLLPVDDNVIEASKKKGYKRVIPE